MSISKRDISFPSSTGRGRSPIGRLARWGLCGLLVGCAWMVSGATARANSAVDALIGSAVDTALSRIRK